LTAPILVRFNGDPGLLGPALLIRLNKCHQAAFRAIDATRVTHLLIG
jgi:hypothetical protein